MSFIPFGGGGEAEEEEGGKSVHIVRECEDIDTGFKLWEMEAQSVNDHFCRLLASQRNRWNTSSPSGCELNKL